MPPTAASAGRVAWRDRGQLAPHQLALDLQPDQEEEHRHQAVVDPQQQRLVERERADAHADRRVEEQAVQPGQRRVVDQQRRQRRRHQHEPAGRLVMEEGERALQPVAYVGRWASCRARVQGGKVEYGLALAGGENAIQADQAGARARLRPARRRSRRPRKQSGQHVAGAVRNGAARAALVLGDRRRARPAACRRRRRCAAAEVTTTVGRPKLAGRSHDLRRASRRAGRSARSARTGWAWRRRQAGPAGRGSPRPSPAPRRGGRRRQGSDRRTPAATGWPP